METWLELSSPGALSPLAQVSRSGFLESIHHGCIAVSDTTGALLASAGNPASLVFWRSTAKLHQALPLVMAGARDRFGLTEPELAIMCASHRGEAEQIRHVESILHKIGLGPQALHCGTQVPDGPEAAKKLFCAGGEPSTLHNACSGNHAGLLALTRLLGGNEDGYEAREAPAQQRALELIARFADLEPSAIFLGIDGCSIPTYRTPLSALAVSFARLLAVPTEWPTEIREAAHAITRAVIANPTLLSGAGEVDAELIRAFDGEGICKVGAEGVCAAAFRPSPRWPKGLGIAIKIADGGGNRARDVALGRCVEQLELGTPDQRAAFHSRINRRVLTRRGQAVGEITPAFSLTFVA